jgi:hypothetical protein
VRTQSPVCAVVLSPSTDRGVRVVFAAAIPPELIVQVMADPEQCPTMPRPLVRLGLEPTSGEYDFGQFVRSGNMLVLNLTTPVLQLVRSHTHTHITARAHLRSRSSSPAINREPTTWAYTATPAARTRSRRSLRVPCPPFTASPRTRCCC